MQCLQELHIHVRNTFVTCPICQSGTVKNVRHEAGLRDRKRAGVTLPAAIYANARRRHHPSAHKRALQRETQRAQHFCPCESSRHHEPAPERLVALPQALLPEDARAGGQPAAAEATHAARQRVQEPHASGRHQRVRDRERRSDFIHYYYC